MTALLVLENCKLDDKVVIGKIPSSFVDGNKIYLFEDEEFTVNQLLHALLIESANDVALALAEHISGSVQEFAGLMNRRAAQLGCYNTNFVNPNGLHDDNHYTTAYDMSLITREAMKNPTFRELVTTENYTIQPTNKQPEQRHFWLSNWLIFETRYQVEGANGVKTGFTDEAHHTIVGSAVRGDTNLMVVLLSDPSKVDMYKDASSLLKYGFDTYKTVKEVSEGNILSYYKVPRTDTQIPLTAG